MLINENAEAAIFLTVMEYSLDFWNDAIDNTDNPWHNFVTVFTFNDHGMPPAKNIFINPKQNCNI